ncbi:MAG: carboxypeptidase-like regulatory domain-containing protein [Saprospiraceae bacterium]|nr:carboxypeptidase-like regulatory domain-containing protein [Saprospiraceae bacterium]
MLKTYLPIILILISWFIGLGEIYGQQIFLFEKLRFNNEEIKGKKIEDHIAWLESKKNVTVSYSSLAIDPTKVVNIKDGIYSIEDFLYKILDDFEVTIEFRAPSKILIIPAVKTEKEKLFIISGYVKDKISHEVLIGAIVQVNNQQQYTISNVSGYYSLVLPKGQHEIIVNYLGYRILQENVEVEKNMSMSLFMEFQNELPSLTISQERINYWNLGDNIDAFKTKEFKSLLGESDPLNNVKVIPGVQSGGEGQSGLFVRGGGADQNLVLLEGVPLYEYSHTVGIASLFMEESVKEASLIKNGFPARYGGRLSAVMDVNLKEGNTKEHERLISIGIPGIKFHANGPIFKNKTTYNFSMRTSWINYYIDKFLLKFTNYDIIQLSYRDIVGKITHRFAENHKISFSFYSGGDRLSLQKSLLIDSVGYSFASSDYNRLSWSNTLGSIQWYFTPNNKWSFQAQAGILSYKHRARSSYTFETSVFEESRLDELDIFSYSDILTTNLTFSADYYLNEKNTIKMGFEHLYHNFNPVVKQSTIILEGEEENILDKDSLIVASETNFFIEDHLKIHKKFSIYAGIHLNTFRSSDTSYFSWQPRLSMIWKPFKNHITNAAVTRMRQNIHLLVNLGLGLPSDLWVPTTNKIQPANSWQYSITHSYKFDNDHFLQLGAYYKRMSGLLEFLTPVDLFYFFINETEVVPVFNTSKDWERNVLNGQGTAKGIELLFQRKNKLINGWFSGSWSKSDRTFSGIDNGKTFPFRYDRTWDVNAGISLQLNKDLSVASNFVYGTGNAFSLATEEYVNVLGTTVIHPGTRNNRRLPAFHQLSFNLNYSKPFLKDGKWTLHLNLYNVYNRLNAYFIYIYKNPLTKESLAKKVSILPITPSIYFSVTF